MNRVARILLLGGVVCAGPLMAAAADTPDIQPPADTRWRILLKDQVKADKSCDLADVLTYSELKIGDEVSISGKISCVDGRQYDYSRPRPHQKFEFRLCEPSVC